MEKKKKWFIDIHSINFHLWIYFTAFAIAVVAIIGALQFYLVNNYYSDMKEEDTEQIANQIKNIYLHSTDAQSMYRRINDIAGTNDINIILRRSSNGSTQELSFNGMNPTYSKRINANTQIRELTAELMKQQPPDKPESSSDTKSSGTGSSSSGSSSGSSGSSASSGSSGSSSSGSSSSNSDSSIKIQKRSVKRTVSIGENMTVLGYACILPNRLDTSTEYMTSLFIFAPLYPATSTLRILKRILWMIAIIASLLALILALILSNRISRPINKITKSAGELSDGNYDVDFEGKPYSETMELAKTLTVAENEMKRTDEYHKDLIANVSHDLRTPLTMIKSYAEMIRDLSGDNPEKRNRHLSVIIDEADRLNNMVTDLLNLSRLQSKKIVLDKKEFDLNEAAESMLSGYKLMNDSEGYNISFNRCKGACVVDADPVRIDQVMNNLLSNAIKYCGEDKVIIIRTKKEDNTVLFSVTDHGRGIKPEELPHVWDRYYKSSTNHVRPTEGSGVGLSIVKELLKLHEAEYGVESEVGKGSTFWFRLKLVKHPKGNAKNNAKSSARNGAAGGSGLIG
jgi:signal transduction histidine kinase